MAMSKACVGMFRSIASFGSTITVVSGLITDEQVLRSDTSRIIAMVKHMFLIGDGTDIKFPSKPVSG
jgi:hypothetical protein